MYCCGEDYQEVDEVALRLRMDYCHFEKRLDVFKLAEQLNMILIKYSSLTKEQLSAILSKEELKDGFTVIKKCNGEYKFYTFYKKICNNMLIRQWNIFKIYGIVLLMYYKRSVI